MSDEVTRCMEEILAMNGHNTAGSRPAKAATPEAEFTELKDEDILPLEAHYPPTPSVQEQKALLAKFKSALPPTVKKTENPFGPETTDVFADFVERTDEAGLTQKVLSSLYLETAEMMTSCVLPYLRRIHESEQPIPYKINLTITNKKDGEQQKYLSVKPDELVVKIREYMMGGNTTQSNVIPITQAKGAKLPPPVPADTYKGRATTA